MGDDQTIVRPMTGHELARRLLTLPDLPIITENDMGDYSVTGAEVWDDQVWYECGLLVDERRGAAIRLLNSMRP